MKQIIWTRPDGALCVTTPVINTHPVRESISEDQAVARALAKLPKDAMNVAVVEESAIPTDRTFRNAWRQNGSSVATDMGLAREIHKQRLRDLREPLLEALDIAFLKAMERGDTDEQILIVSEKQALRDVTYDPAIESAKTPDELRQVLPDILK